MARRRVKKRTQGAKGGAAPAPGNAPTSRARKPGSRSPKSMVIRIGASEVGPSISQLVHDVRSMLEPDTAVRLKERRNNKLRDYTTMAGPLGVSHLLLFSRSKDSGNVNLRVAVTPRGPTLSFRVEGYSLAKDVMKAQRRPRAGEKDLFLNAPLLVMNNFSSQQNAEEGVNGEDKKQQQRVPKHLETLTTTIFQSLFPPINPTNTPLKNIRRILLLDRSPPDSSDPDSASYVLNLRHYAIETRTAKSVPKPLRRLDTAAKVSHTAQKQKRKSGGLPDLGRLDDVSDYILDPSAAADGGFTSGSDSEPDTDAEVEVLAPTAQRVQKRRTKKDDDQDSRPNRRDSNRPFGPTIEKKGIKLHELGPRLKLRMTKVEEGLCGGKVMWHEYIHKSPEEVRKMEKVHEEKRRVKEERRAEQRANVERKRVEKKANGKDGEVEEGEDDEDEEMDEDLWDDEEDFEPSEDEDEVMNDDGEESEDGVLEDDG